MVFTAMERYELKHFLQYPYRTLLARRESENPVILLYCRVILIKRRFLSDPGISDARVT